MNNKKNTTQEERQTDSDEMTSCAKCEEYLAGWRRAQADYQNLQKQSEREKIDFQKYANEHVLSDLVTVLDQFNLAIKYMPTLEALPEEERQKWKNWLVGMEAVKTKWDELAKTHNLSEVKTSGVFNPSHHEAVEERSHDEVPPGHVIETIESGWKLHDKLIRPAKVIIAKRPEETQVEPETKIENEK